MAMREWLEQHIGKAPTDLIAKFFPTIIAVIVSLIVIKLVMKIVKKGIEKSKLEKGLHTFVEKTIAVILYFIAILIVADTLGIPINSLIAAFSVVGLAASLAIQDILSNLASGVLVLMIRPFKTGDYVDVSNVSGTVKEITFTHTVLNTIDNKVIRVPNKDVVGATIVDYSENKYRRIFLTFDISYDAETKKVLKTLREAVNRTSHIVKDREIFIRVTAYKDSSIEYSVRVWVKNEHYWDVYFDLLEIVKEELDKNEIQIPYNQLDVHVHNVSQ